MFDNLCNLLLVADMFARYVKEFIETFKLEPVFFVVTRFTYQCALKTSNLAIERF